MPGRAVSSAKRRLPPLVSRTERDTTPTSTRVNPFGRFRSTSAISNRPTARRLGELLLHRSCNRDHAPARTRPDPRITHVLDIENHSDQIAVCGPDPLLCGVAACLSSSPPPVCPCPSPFCLPLVFVKTTRVRRGNKTYEYLSLVERSAMATLGHHVLFRLGEAEALRSSGELDRIITALAGPRRRTAGWPSTSWPPTLRLAVGAVAAVRPLWHRLGLDAWFATVGAERAPKCWSTRCWPWSPTGWRPVFEAAPARMGGTDVVMPVGFEAPSLEQYYRALDAVADTKDATEAHLYAAHRSRQLGSAPGLLRPHLDLLRGLTATVGPVPVAAFGHSRDHRSDRPQVVIGLLCTGDGIPVAHHVFAGNTADVSTLPAVLEDLQDRFGSAPSASSPTGGSSPRRT